MTAPQTDPTRALRWGVYALLIAIALGDAAGRLLAVNSVNRADLEKHHVNRAVEAEGKRLRAQGLDGEDLEEALFGYREEATERLQLQRPFLSANDRSRWLAIRALVDEGGYPIDGILDLRVWNTIDMVQHQGPDGELHLYSSKPPLLLTLIAGEYWLVQKLTGLNLADNPFVVGRLILLTINLPMLAMLFWYTTLLVDRYGQTDWGRVVAVGVLTQGTLLTPFAVVLNNHLIGAACAAATLYFTVEIIEGRGTPRVFILAGLAAAFTTANELPALSLLAAVAFALVRVDAGRTLRCFLPAVLVVAAAFFATNYAAHQSLRPPYMYRSQTDPENDWYHYTYEVEGRTLQSHWNDPPGLDRGEPSRAVYALHTLVGHHGIFSLTPAWVLSVIGLAAWLRSGTSTQRDIALAVAVLSVVCLVFFIGLRPQPDRNYGGSTCGFRWMFWFVPLWTVPLTAGVDRLAGSRTGRALTLVLVSFSVLSARFPTWNPWTHPWIYRWMEHLGAV